MSKTKNTILIYCFLLLSTTIYSQTSNVWIRTFGGSQHDYANCIIQTNDGGYIVAGRTRSYDGDVQDHNGFEYDDFWIIKLNELGTIQWTRTLGGSSIDVASSIEQTQDGGFIIAGNSMSFDGDVIGNHGGPLKGDFWIVKLDINGNTEWAKCYGGSYDEVAYSIKQAQNGDYIIAGSSNSNDGDVTDNNGSKDYWIIRIDEDGNLKWQESYGGSNTDVAHSIDETEDGGFVIAGMSNSTDGDISGNHGWYDFWVIKIDSLGSIVWEKAFGGSKEDKAYSIKTTTDKGYIIAGLTYSNDGDVVHSHYDSTLTYLDGVYYWVISDDFWIVKLDSLGNLEWQKSYGGSSVDYAESIYQCNDGGYVVAGCSYSNNGDISNSFEPASLWILKLNSTGDILDDKKFGSRWGEAKSIQQTIDGGYVVAGNTLEESGFHDYIIGKFDENFSIAPENDVLIYPNPANNFINIVCKNFTYVEVFDIIGRRLLISNEEVVELNKYAHGLLIVKVFDKEGNIYLKKIVKAR